MILHDALNEALDEGAFAALHDRCMFSDLMVWFSDLLTAGSSCHTFLYL